MKRLAMVLVALSAVSALAQEEGKARGWFAGLNAGIGEVNRSNQNSSFSQDDNGLVFSLVGGYQFSRYFGLEAGYVKFDEMSVGSADNFLILEPEGFKFMVFGRAPLGESFALLGKAGFYKNESDDKLVTLGQTYSDSNDGGIAYEVGAEYQVAPSWHVGVSAARYDLDWPNIFGPDGDLTLFQAGVRYLF